MTWVWVAVGGALGSLGRYGVALWLQRDSVAAGLPWATLSVNVLGSFIIGLVWVWLHTRTPAAFEQLRGFIMVGVLGGFTTFSSFSLESMQLLLSNEWGRALAYIGLSVLFCLLGTWLGILAGRGLI